PDVFEVFVQLCYILWPETFRETLDALCDTVKNAGALIQLQCALLFGGSVTAEHPLENDARVQLHWQRLSRRPPAEGAHIRTQIVACATPEVAGMVFGCKLHGGESGVLTDFLGDHLIHSRVQLQHVALMGNRSAEKSRAADGVSGFPAVVQPRHHDDIVTEW